MAFWVVSGGSPHSDTRAATASSSATSAGHVAAYLTHGDGGRVSGYASSHNGSAFGPSGKRRVVYPDGTAASTYSDEGCYGFTKRPRLDDWGTLVGFQDQGHHGTSEYGSSIAQDDAYRHSASAAMERGGSVKVNNLAFLVIQERDPSPPTTPTPPLPVIALDCPVGFPPPLRAPPSVTNGLSPVQNGAASMERTQSGLSISSDTSTVHTPCDEDRDCGHNHPLLLDDLAAAHLVDRHVNNIKRKRHRDSQHGRILKALINPKSREANFPLDNDALRSIFSAANEIFFDNKLTQRVTWDWSHPASAQYERHIVGTTALRRSARLGGYETLIVLSSPILKDTKYNRRLLISTFLHEMIHSFMFIMCGFEARQCGGHTEGFRQIAEIIDDWVGKDYLRLRDMEADLERFIDDNDALTAPSHSTDTGMNLTSHHGYSYDAGREAAWPVSEWKNPESPDDRIIQAPQPRRYYPNNLDDWEWHDREGFPARGVSSYSS